MGFPVFENKANPKMVKHALLVAPYRGYEKLAYADILSEEFAELVNALRIPIVSRKLVHYRANLTSPLKGRASTR